MRGWIGEHHRGRLPFGVRQRVVAEIDRRAVAQLHRQPFATNGDRVDVIQQRPWRGGEQRNLLERQRVAHRAVNGSAHRAQERQAARRDEPGEHAVVTGDGDDHAVDVEAHKRAALDHPNAQTVRKLAVYTQARDQGVARDGGAQARERNVGRRHPACGELERAADLRRGVAR